MLPGKLIIVLLLGIGIGVAFGSGYVAQSDIPYYNQSGMNETLDNISLNLTTDENTTEIERAIHTEINNVRQKHGLEPLDYNRKLSDAATIHSRDMAKRDYFSHTSPDGEDFSDRYEEVGFDCRAPREGNMYATGGENIAKRTDSGNETKIARDIVEQWMNSPGHRANILKNYWRMEGIGVVIDGTDVYATQNFC